MKSIILLVFGILVTSSAQAATSTTSGNDSRTPRQISKSELTAEIVKMNNQFQQKDIDPYIGEAIYYLNSILNNYLAIQISYLKDNVYLIDTTACAGAADKLAALESNPVPAKDPKSQDYIERLAKAKQELAAQQKIQARDTKNLGIEQNMYSDLNEIFKSLKQVHGFGSKEVKSKEVDKINADLNQFAATLN